MSSGVLTIRVSRRRTSPSIFFRSLALTVCPSCNMSLVLLRWGFTLRRAENANQAEGLAPINGVCLNLALVASTRLLVELYMLITSIRYPHSISTGWLRHRELC